MEAPQVPPVGMIARIPNRNVKCVETKMSPKYANLTSSRRVLEENVSETDGQIVAVQHDMTEEKFVFMDTLIAPMRQLLNKFSLIPNP